MSAFSRIWVIVAVGLVVLVALVGFLVTSGKPALPVMPSPNGYEDLVKAGAMVAPGTDKYGEMEAASLKALVAENAEALKLARLGIQRESRVTPEDSQALTQTMTQVTGLKSLSRAFAAEGRLAELNGQTNQAALVYRDGVRAAVKVSRGALIIGSMVAQAMEAIQLRALSGLTDGVDAATAREIAKSLAQSDAERESPDQVLTNEREWVARVWGIGGRLMKFATTKSHQKVEANFRQKSADLQRQNRALTLRFATRAYQLEKGKAPGNAADLVPDYLVVLPTDPSTGKAMELER